MDITVKNKAVETEFADKDTNATEKKEESKMKIFWKNHKKAIVAGVLTLGGIAAAVFIGKKKSGDDDDDEYDEYEADESEEVVDDEEK